MTVSVRALAVSFGKRSMTQSRAARIGRSPTRNATAEPAAFFSDDSPFFPNGDLSGFTAATEMERARWEILDAENLRLHYARTSRQWVERLRARADEARALVGERIYRTWLLYLTCSAVAFEAGSIGLYQVPARKHGDRTGGAAPTTREDLYARSRPCGFPMAPHHRRRPAPFPRSPSIHHPPAPHDALESYRRSRSSRARWPSGVERARVPLRVKRDRIGMCDRSRLEWAYA